MRRERRKEAQFFRSSHLLPPVVRTMSHGSAELGALTSHTEPMSTMVLLVGQGHEREHGRIRHHPVICLTSLCTELFLTEDHDAHLPGGTAVLLLRSCASTPTLVGGHLTTSSPPDDFTWARVTPSSHHIPWVQQKAQKALCARPPSNTQVSSVGGTQSHHPHSRHLNLSSHHMQTC